MAKRNAKKQATRTDVEASDPVCVKLASLAVDVDVLVLTLGADYDSEASAETIEYEKRLQYLPVLIDELIEYRISVVVADENKPEKEFQRFVESRTPSAEDPTTHEGSPNAADHEPETE